MVFLHRRASGAQISIERLFEQVREAMDDSVVAEVHVSPHSGGGIRGRLGNIRAARRALRGRDVGHITGDVHYLALGLDPRRTVLTIHDCGILHRLHGWRREVVRRLWFEWPVRRSAVATTISETTRRDLLRWLPPGVGDRIRVVPNCVGKEFTPSPKSFDAAAPKLLQVGTGWNKNLERVVEAVVGTGFRLTVVGPVDEARQRHIRESGVGIEFLGRVDSQRLVEAYRECDALVFASLFEGFGMPILEAQAIGRPVITSNRSAMPEVAGDSAVLVDPESVEEIRAAIIRLRDEAELRDSLVRAGLRNVEAYRGEVIGARYLEIYRELSGASATRE